MTAKQYYIDNKGRIITFLDISDEQQKFEAYGCWKSASGEVKFKLKRIEQ